MTGRAPWSAARHRLAVIRDLREKVAFLERQLDAVSSSCNGWERACHDADARIGALIEHVGWAVAEPILDRADQELANAR